MAHPKRKHSKSRARKRSAGRSTAPVTLRACARCGTQGRPHAVCEECGHYKGREVVPKDDF
ncbi:MAG TPA: 50S ribosomal protein L32 [Planctomycetes bacterium]|nr:50S ribosomal protein L32 [Planctomycetota bacterium]